MDYERDVIEGGREGGGQEGEWPPRRESSNDWFLRTHNSELCRFLEAQRSITRRIDFHGSFLRKTVIQRAHFGKEA